MWKVVGGEGPGRFYDVDAIVDGTLPLGVEMTKVSKEGFGFVRLLRGEQLESFDGLGMGIGKIKRTTSKSEVSLVANKNKSAALKNEERRIPWKKIIVKRLTVGDTGWRSPNVYSRALPLLNEQRSAPVQLYNAGSLYLDHVVVEQGH